MRIDHYTKLFLVTSDGVSESTLKDLTLAVQGGIKIEDVTVFTDKQEATLEHNRRETLQRIMSALNDLNIDQLEDMMRTVSDEHSNRRAKV